MDRVEQDIEREGEKKIAICEKVIGLPESLLCRIRDWRSKRMNPQYYTTSV